MVADSGGLVLELRDNFGGGLEAVADSTDDSLVVSADSEIKTENSF